MDPLNIKRKKGKLSFHLPSCAVVAGWSIKYTNSVGAKAQLNWGFTKGQQAMITAKAYPEGVMGRPEKGAGKVSPQETLNRKTLHKARVVVEHAEDLVDAVVTGDLPLNQAYEKAFVKGVLKAFVKALPLDGDV